MSTGIVARVDETIYEVQLSWSRQSNGWGAYLTLGEGHEVHVGFGLTIEEALINATDGIRLKTEGESDV